MSRHIESLTIIQCIKSQTPSVHAWTGAKNLLNSIEHILKTSHNLCVAKTIKMEVSAILFYFRLCIYGIQCKHVGPVARSQSLGIFCYKSEHEPHRQLNLEYTIVFALCFSKMEFASFLSKD